MEMENCACYLVSIIAFICLVNEALFLVIVTLDTLTQQNSLVII